VSDPSERRSEQRQPVTLLVDYEGPDDLVADFTENLSMGGTFVQTEREMAPGTRVRLVLSCSGLIDAIGLAGVVRWTRPRSDSLESGAGIEFEPYADDVRKRLAQIIEAIAVRDPAVIGRVVDVLLVEDNRHMVNLLRDGLILARDRIGENVAFRFRVAGDGGEAMALIEGHSFDAAIVDMYLPVLDGGAVIARIRKNQLTQFIPVIAISAGGRDAADAALAAGADRFIAKPVRLREIADALKVLAGL
jgi:uncharacterized protein (TIGR02266 family)